MNYLSGLYKNKFKLGGISMNLQDEMNKIDIFLKNVSAEEFDDILEKCGINQILSGEADNKELLFNTPDDIEDELDVPLQDITDNL